ncbi:MAG: c-type cytochrome domain-containing protein, partial [Planctomycetota bacterium]
MLVQGLRNHLAGNIHCTPMAALRTLAITLLLTSGVGLGGAVAQEKSATEKSATEKPATEKSPPEKPAVESLDPQHAQKMKAGLELFQKDVRPVLVGRCVKCHGGEMTEGEFDLNTREALLKASENGPQVVAGKPQESRLLKLIRQE